MKYRLKKVHKPEFDEKTPDFFGFFIGKNGSHWYSYGWQNNQWGYIDVYTRKITNERLSTNKYLRRDYQEWARKLEANGDSKKFNSNSQ